MTLARRVYLALATGYIWYFFSERVFWSFWRVTDSPLSLVGTLLVYSIAAYVCLELIVRYKVRNVWSVFILGSIFGWLIEGVFAMTFFGVDGIPFPYTISWTALAWHALISVGIGWFLFQHALLNSLRWALFVSIGLGSLWGAWSLEWAQQGAVAPTPPRFFLHAVIATLLLMLAQRAYHRYRGARFAASIRELQFLGILIGGYFLFMTLPKGGMLVVALLALLALSFFALRKNGEVETKPPVLVVFSEEIPWKRSITVLVMPCVATLIYAVFGTINAPTQLFILMATCMLGFALYIVSFIQVLRRRS